MIKEGSNALAIECFKDHPGQPLQADPNESRKKGKGGKTVSSYFKGQLDDLMSVLYKTEPHFIRCVVPNTHKTGGLVDPGLYWIQTSKMWWRLQLKYFRADYAPVQVQWSLSRHCDLQERLPEQGVYCLNIKSDGCFLQMDYPEFKARYNIIAAKAVAKAKSAKDGGKAVMEALSLDKEKYRLGHTKVFFRAGVAAWMEEQREGKIGSVLAWLQSGARGKASRMQFKKLQRYFEFHSSIIVFSFSAKSCHCTPARGQFETCRWQRLGPGCRSGCS